MLLALLSMLVLPHMDHLLRWMDYEPDVVRITDGYLEAVIWGLPAAYVFLAIRHSLDGLGITRPCMYLTLLGLCVNIIGNYALIFGNFGFPRLELVGAGLASSLVACFMFAGLLIYTLLHRKLKRYALLIRLWRADWPLFRDIFRIGTPIGGTILMEAGMFAAAAQMMGRIGTTELAAHTIAIQCVSVAFMLPLGLGQAATIRVGLADGSGRWDDIGHAGWSAMALGMFCVVLTVLAYLLLPVTLVGFFLDLDLPENRAVLDYAVIYLAIAALFQLFDSGQVIASCGLRGLRDTRKPMLLAALGYWGIGVPTALLLGFELEWGGKGIWLGLAVGLAVTAVMLIARFALRERLHLVHRH